MKTIAKLILGIAVAASFQGCSSTDNVVGPEGKRHDITVTVITDDALHAARAAAPVVEGYELKCIMQLFADDGVAVGSRYTLDAASGAATFLIQAQDLENGATRAVFWAEYQPLDATRDKAVYNSKDLSDITYNVTEFDMTDERLMAAADAFTGVITDLTDGATATLKRPFIKLNFSPKNPEAAHGARKIVVKYKTPSGFNALRGICGEDSWQDVQYTAEPFDPAASPWFSTLIIAPANMERLQQNIFMNLSGRVDQYLTIKANTIPLDANFIVNATAEVSEEATQDLVVEVNIDGEFVNDPSRPVEMQVGAYINAQGNATADPSQAVGIVFYMGAISGDKISLYPPQFADKMIKGYAVAIENVAKARAQLNAAPIAAGLTPNENLYNGTQNTEYILGQIGESALHTAWTEWTGAHAMQSDGTTTDWYIPSRNQFEEWISMLIPTTTLKNTQLEPSGTPEFIAMFPLNTIFDRDPFQNCMYVTSSVNSGGNIQGANITASGRTGSARFSQIDVKTKTQSVLCRPMITIFE